jgi:hypothetical protein
MERGGMNKDLDVITPHQPKAPRALPRGHNNRFLHINVDSNIICTKFKSFSLIEEDYLWFCGYDHPSKVKHFRIAKAPANALAIPSEGLHGDRGASKAGASA